MEICLISANYKDFLDYLQWDVTNKKITTRRYKISKKTIGKTSFFEMIEVNLHEICNRVKHKNRNNQTGSKSWGFPNDPKTTNLYKPSFGFQMISLHVVGLPVVGFQF